MELIFTLAIIYVAIVIPFKLWQTTGKLEYLQKDTDKTIEQLKFNNDYYINQINELSKNLAEEKATSERYWKLYLIESYHLSVAMEFVENIGETQYEDLLDLLNSEDDDD